MERIQHTIQDSCEAYAVYVMQKTAEELGVASVQRSDALWAEFTAYVREAGLTLEEMRHGPYKKYMANVDLQIPRFVKRLADQYPGSTLGFENVERDARNDGMKADVRISVSSLETPIAMSLKNYEGAGGIARPQVSSGTFSSFAAGFIFSRVGVGKYEDPRPGAAPPTFQGANVDVRNEVLEHMYGKGTPLLSLLARLDELNREMRDDLLGADCEHYRRDRVREAVDRCAEPAMDAVLRIFDILGGNTVREKFLARIGMDGTEEALFFDSERYVDSITSGRYHALREKLNAQTTAFTYRRHRQNIRFEFTDAAGETLLRVDVPFTINTNGAWYRPRERFRGTRVYNDKGHAVELVWGQRRPYKSREIATSTNTYLDLARTGIFG